ncbi:MAG: serine hydrolase domain-containing protein, partial [Myxococcota bacterium]
MRWALVMLLVGSCGVETQSELDLLIEEQMDVGGVPSLAAGLIVDGELVWEGYYGFANIDAKERPTAHTLYPVASVSKLFTAVPVLRLVEDGRVDLDAPIDVSFGFSLVHPEHVDTPVTLRQLLTHSSGLEDNWFMLGQTTFEGDPEISLAEFAREYTRPGGEYYVAETNFGAAPGSRSSYCNAAFALAGHLAEIGWERDFRDLTRTQIFEPLGLQETGWFLADVDPAKLAIPYSYNPRRGQSPLEQSTFAHYPAGGLRSSIYDLSRFAQAILGGGELEGARIFNEETVQEMVRLQIPELSNRQGLVMRYDTVNGRQYVGHSGAGLGGSAQFLLRPEDNAAMIVLTNSDAYVRARLGFREGRDAIERILEA